MAVRKTTVVVSILFLVVQVLLAVFFLYLLRDSEQRPPIMSQKGRGENPKLYRQVVDSINRAERMGHDAFWAEMFGDGLAWIINLKHRRDRRAHCLAEFRKYGINAQRRLSWYHPEKDPRGGVHGVWGSHRHCLGEIYKTMCATGAQFGLMLEDDMHLHPQWLTRLAQMRPFIDENQEWDLISLHHNGHIDERGPLVYHGHGLCMIGYLVSRRYLDSHVNAEGVFSFPEPKGIHLDLAFYMDEESSIYTSRAYWPYEDVIVCDLDLGTDNTEPWYSQLAVKVIGRQRTFNLHHNLIGVINSFHPGWARQLALEAAKKDEVQRGIVRRKP